MSYKGRQYWNHLPPELKNQGKTKPFKSELKKDVYKNALIEFLCPASLLHYSYFIMKSYTMFCSASILQILFLVLSFTSGNLCV